MKRRSLMSGRVALTLPQTFSAFPQECVDLSGHAFEQGGVAAHRIHKREKVIKADFPELEALLAGTPPRSLIQASFLRTMFFAGLNKVMKGFNDLNALRNRDITFNSDTSGAYLQQALMQLFLHMDDNARIRVISLYKRVQFLQTDAWTIDCMGAIAVARTAHALLSQGLKVYLPSPSEDVVWKIDLFARIRGESECFCFSIKSDRTVQTGAKVCFLTNRHLLSGTKSQRMFFSGVQKFGDRHAGCYVAVELFVSPQRNDPIRDDVLARMIQEYRRFLLPPPRRAQPTQVA